jgi:hypothetical protein
VSDDLQDNSSHNSVLKSYLDDQSIQGKSSSKGGEGGIGVPHTIMQVPSPSKSVKSFRHNGCSPLYCDYCGVFLEVDEVVYVVDGIDRICCVCLAVGSSRDSLPSDYSPEKADERCLGPISVNSHGLEMGSRCGPCTAECYGNCGVWMPSGNEIREVWRERAGKLD